MLRHLLALSGCLSLFITCGCAVCASSHDCKYAAYGGIRERADMVRGRVGSVFDPAPEISHVDRSGQSPQRVDPDFDAPELWDDEDRDAAAESDEPTVEDPDRTETPPSLLPDDDATELPDIPNDGGTIELPELDGETPPPAADDLLETSTERSAWRNPLLDLFPDEL